ncbi:shikimate kinase [Chryseobacterium salipaludis]|uniref:shikimate kinase n=1 Tax=Chryseobacterium TaxID=59732 RepID=UPI001FF18CE2|nr:MULTISPECIES: shikimate kinase [Chryseobacterium]MCJ8497081.1 shikimate kinase [Chryseobacterium salipaludis]MCX3296562.1 shikimate kinase [Planobacterium sp. JC490]
MIISLLGYMGSGKSHISKILSQKTNYSCIDLDKEISQRHKLSIAEIFAQRGELFFRRQERLMLEEILETRENCIMSLGGGTPAYYDNMALLKDKTTTVYLRASIATLVSRLSKHKERRPMIARLSDEELPEYIAKHLFERQTFYTQAEYTVITDNKTPEEIAAEIAALV